MDKKVESILPVRLRNILKNTEYQKNVEEIRLRSGKKVILETNDIEREIVIDYVINKADIDETLEYISHSSLYAYEEDIKAGFITVCGGHRVGIAGKVVREQGHIKTISNISSINIRVSHELIGCSSLIVPWLFDKNMFCNTLVVSSPGHGKTTLLRDMIRELSDNYMYKICVADERSEIASCYMGIPQNNIGIRTDVYDQCPKKEGIMLMIRVMSPQIIAVDEIGNIHDMHAVIEAIRCGCRIIATIHGDCVKDILDKAFIRGALKDRLFKRFVLIKSSLVNNLSERQYEIYDDKFNLLTTII